MEKALLIVGIVLIVAAVAALLFAALHLHGYKNLVDGTAGHYDWLRRKTTVYFVAGIALAVIGAACIVLHTKI